MQRRQSSRLKGKGKLLTGRVTKPAPPSYYLGHVAFAHAARVLTGQFVLRRNCQEPDWDVPALERAARGGLLTPPDDARLVSLFLERISEHRYRELLRKPPARATILGELENIVVYES